MSDFARTLAMLRKSAGIPQTTLARQAGLTQSALSLLEQGRREPQMKTARSLDEALGSDRQLVNLATCDPTPAPAPTEPVGSEDVQQIHDDIARLVEMDSQHGGTDLIPMATRLFREATGRLRSGACPKKLRADFAAATAELGEVAGWLAFDANQYDRARTLSMEALSVARGVGDRDMELFLLGNLSLLELEDGNAAGAEQTAHYMETFRLSPRLQALAAMRRARALADLGDPSAPARMDRARGTLQDGARDSDPAWAWWINDREMLIHEAGVHRKVGNVDRAVACYYRGQELCPKSYRWGRLSGASMLADVLVQVGQFDEANRMTSQVRSLASGVTSARAAMHLHRAATRAREVHAPEELSQSLGAACRQVAY